METISDGAAPVPPEQHSRARRWLWLVVGVVLALLAAMITWVIVEDGASESGPPTVTFDRDQSFYSGPSTILAADDGLWTVTIVNDTDDYVLWSLGVLADDHPSEEEHRDWMTTQRTQADYPPRAFPPWVSVYDLGSVNPGEATEVQTRMNGTVAIDFIDRDPLIDGEGYSLGFIEVETATG